MNECYAQILKQLRSNPHEVLDPLKPRKKEGEGTADLAGEGDPAYFFPETVDQSGHPVHTMPTHGAVRHLQILYALLLTTVPGPDFAPVVKSELRKLADREYVEKAFRYSRKGGREEKPGSGVIVNYARVCLKLLATAEARQMRDLPVHCAQLGAEEIEAIQERPPIFVTVSVFDFDLEGGEFENTSGVTGATDVHVKPWETEGKLRRMCARALRLHEGELDSASLYLNLPARTAAGEKVNAGDVAGGGAGRKDVDAAMAVPMLIPPKFKLGELALSDNFGLFRFDFRRRLFLGTWYLKVLPITSIALPKGRSYDEPLAVWRETEGGRGCDFWSAFRFWKTTGLLMGYEMPRGRGLERITECWREHLGEEIVEAFGTATIASRFIFGPEVTGQNDWWIADLKDRICRACLVAARMAACVVLRMREKEPPIPGMKWEHWKTLER